MTNWLGLDIGEKRIGLATGSDRSFLAEPRGILVRRSKKEDVAALTRIAAETGADVLLVGLPLNMDGTEGPQALSVRNYMRFLSRRLPLPVLFWDERLTSFAADEIIAQRGRRRSLHNDDVAAAVLLQSFLDDLRAGKKHDKVTSDE